MANDVKSPEGSSGRTTTPVSVPTDIVRQLRVISAHRGVPQSEILEPLIRLWITREYRKVIAEINRDTDLGGES